MKSATSESVSYTHLDVYKRQKRIYRQYKELVPDDGEALPLDVCYVLRDGSDVTLVTWGAQVKEALEAADALAKTGISAEVIDVATLTPLDFATIAESVAKTGRCVICLLYTSRCV